MKRDFDVVIERDSDGYFLGSVPSCPGCHTQAKSLDSLLDRRGEAIALYLRERPPSPQPLEFLGVLRVSFAH